MSLPSTYTQHHTLNPRLISDIIIVSSSLRDTGLTLAMQGLNDRWTVPFALSADLSAVGSPN